MKLYKCVLIMTGLAAVSVAGRSQSTPPLPPAPFDLDETTIAELQQRMQSGQETSRSIVEKYLARIDALDRRRSRTATA